MEKDLVFEMFLKVMDQSAFEYATSIVEDCKKESDSVECIYTDYMEGAKAAYKYFINDRKRTVSKAN